ncbi:MAG: transporter [Rhodospirillales bacterium]|nr:transporter [Rhodospirillales bacterium]
MSVAPPITNVGGADALQVRAGTYAWYVAVLLGLCHMVSFLDRFVMSLALVPLREAMHLSDTELGLLQGLGFVILYSVVAVPLGRLADSVHRRNMIVIGIFFWSLATAACAYANSFGELFVARIGVGLGEASLVPAAMSLLAVYFNRQRIGRAVSIFTTGALMGHTVAFLAGGAILAVVTPRGGVDLPLLGHFEPWQTLFLAGALPGVFLCVLLFTVHEPKREEKRGTPGFAGAFAYMRTHRRAFAMQFSAAVSAIIIVQSIGAWGPSFFVRLHHVTAAESGYIMGTVALISGVCGSLWGGWFTDFLQRRGVAGAAGAVISIHLTCAVPLALLTFTAGNLTVAMIGFALLQFAVSASVPAGLAGVQVLTPLRYRGIVTSVFLCAVTLIAVGLGPTFVGVLTDRVFGSNGLNTALLLMALVFGSIGAIVAFRARPALERCTRANETDAALQAASQT